MIGTLRAAARLSQRAAFLRKTRGEVHLGKGGRIPFRSFHAEVKQLRVGNRVTFGERTVLKGNSFEFGDYFWSGDDVSIAGHNAKFETGKFCAVAGRVTFLLGRGNHRIQSISPYPFRHLAPFDSVSWTRYFDYETESETYCRMGHDIWIGTGSIVLPNVNIETGAIVSAGSVVTKDIPPYAIVGGNPAQIISFRFKQGLIQELLGLQWWDWPEEKILRNVALFTKNLSTRQTLTGITIAE